MKDDDTYREKKKLEEQQQQQHTHTKKDTPASGLLYYKYIIEDYGCNSRKFIGHFLLLHYIYDDDDDRCRRASYV